MPSLPDFNCYSILGVEKDASPQQIKEAYRKLALAYHPDKNPNNPDATVTFQKISIAYGTLSNTTTRAQHDGRFYPMASFASSHPAEVPGFSAPRGFTARNPPTQTDPSLRSYWPWSEHFANASSGLSGRQAPHEPAVDEMYEELNRAKRDSDGHHGRTSEAWQPYCSHPGFVGVLAGTLSCKFCVRRERMLFKCIECGLLSCGYCLQRVRKSDGDRAREYSQRAYTDETANGGIEDPDIFSLTTSGAKSVIILGFECLIG